MIFIFSTQNKYACPVHTTVLKVLHDKHEFFFFSFKYEWKTHVNIMWKTKSIDDKNMNGFIAYEFAYIVYGGCVMPPLNEWYEELGYFCFVLTFIMILWFGRLLLKKVSGTCQITFNDLKSERSKRLISSKWDGNNKHTKVNKSNFNQKKKKPKTEVH